VKNRTSAAKAAHVQYIYGTAEAVPFVQSVFPQAVQPERKWLKARTALPLRGRYPPLHRSFPQPVKLVRPASETGGAPLKEMFFDRAECSYSGSYMIRVSGPEEPGEKDRGGEIALRRSSSPRTMFSP
jgi:hypothetical protein